MARKILLADDSVTAQNMGRKILADAGYEVITVNNGSAALKKIAEQKPDLIVLDVYMPGYSGLEVCQRLKETQETSRVPVLLTVGKLEPFKPEESKRVRADGFIVKPFEASELLSALSKLEDKIVPRGEASKPGRFARATAALEEGRYDKSVAIDEDSGWKNRIAFPPKKKEKAASKENTDPVDFESTNRDLRSVIEHKLADKPHANKSEEDRVDLGALATAGLPKDVTPEEIAALAAAAAQVKGKIAESKFSGEASGEEANSANTSAALPQELSSATPAPTFTEEKSEEKLAGKIEATEQSSEAAVEASSMALAGQSEGIAAIIGNPEFAASPGAESGGGFSPQAADQTANEPVTMASAGSDGARWTAVSVGLDPDEAALSLEQEMQKAYAAFAAAESGHTASDTPAPESAVGSAELAAATEFSTPQEAAPSEPTQSIPAVLAPEVAQGLSALAEASTEAIRAAAQELETVAESYIREAPAGHESTPAAPQTIEATANYSTTPTFAEKRAEAVAKHDESASLHETKTPEWTNEERKNEEPAAAVARAEDAGQTPADKPEVAASTLVNEVPSEQTPSSRDSSDPMSADMMGAVADPALAAGGGEMAKKDSDAAENTAAAWASWRRIRESGDSKTPPEKTSEFDDMSTPPDTAARAVAAGAEKTPEEISAEAGSDPEAIASIVDSVLADLRPKIFEEISRKMGKKK